MRRSSGSSHHGAVACHGPPHPGDWSTLGSREKYSRAKNSFERYSLARRSPSAPPPARHSPTCTLPATIRPASSTFTNGTPGRQSGSSAACQLGSPTNVRGGLWCHNPEPLAAPPSSSHRSNRGIDRAVDRDRANASVTARRRVRGAADVCAWASVPCAAAARWAASLVAGSAPIARPR